VPTAVNVERMALRRTFFKINIKNFTVSLSKGGAGEKTDRRI